MGRKPLSDIAKSGMFYIRVTAEERAELDAAAVAAGQPKTSTWARDLLLAAARTLQPTAKKAKGKA